MSDDNGFTLSVASDAKPNGGYSLVISSGEDHSWSLNAGQAVAYVMACFQKVAQAEHAYAVFQALLEAGIDEAAAGAFVGESGIYGHLEHANITKPIKFTAGLGRKKATKEYVPIIRADLDGKELGNFQVDQLRDHAQVVITVATVCRFDKNLRKALVKRIGLEDRQAQMFVSSLGEHWPGRLEETEGEDQ